MQQITVTTPGKLIITGEHSVVYGCPALAVPAHLGVTGTIELTGQKTINFNSLLGDSTFALNGIHLFKGMIDANYQAYLRQKISVNKILPKPEALLFYTVAIFQEKYNLKQGIRISLKSKIPLGSGLGSSAAVIVTILSLLYKAFKVEFTTDQLLALAKQCENLQHGQSSGLDVAVAGRQSPVLYSNAMILPFKPSGFKIYAVQIGTPASSTGECVDFVQGRFNPPLKEEFTKTSNQIIEALSSQNFSLFKQAIYKNQRLLEILGVVPDAIIQFRKALYEKLGASFKISGAGSIMGDHAGIGLIVSESCPKEFCKSYGYKVWELDI